MKSVFKFPSSILDSAVVLLPVSAVLLLAVLGVSYIDGNFAYQLDSNVAYQLGAFRGMAILFAAFAVVLALLALWRRELRADMWLVANNFFWILVFGVLISVLSVAFIPVI